MEKLYVHEIRPGGEVSTVGLFYSRGEAEHIVAKLQKLREKQSCRYEITQAIVHISPANPPRPTHTPGKE